MNVTEKLRISLLRPLTRKNPESSYLTKDLTGFAKSTNQNPESQPILPSMILLA